MDPRATVQNGAAVAQRTPPIADFLDAPLDVLVARKIGAPGHEEFAIGAATARGTSVLHGELLRQVLLAPGYLERATEEQRQIAEARAAAARSQLPHVPLAGKIAILADDGIATGMTMFAAIEDARSEGPAAIVVAAPVLAPSAFRELLTRVDRVVALAVPDPFYAVGQFYDDFTRVEDHEAQALLTAGASRRGNR